MNIYNFAVPTPDFFMVIKIFVMQRATAMWGKRDGFVIEVFQELIEIYVLRSICLCASGYLYRKVNEHMHTPMPYWAS